MRNGRHIVLAVVAAALLATAIPTPLSSRSTNACLDCHQNYNMYLDILEGDAANVVPVRLGDGETATVAVMITVTTNTPEYKSISAVSATLSSRNGCFAVASPTSSLGSMSKGQTARASWTISPLATGTDILDITVEGVNLHGPTYYSDSYSPEPRIDVERLAPNLPPSIALTAPAPGSRLSGGSTFNISWEVLDEDPLGCLVDLYYDTGDPESAEVTVATGVPATGNHTWSVPLLDSERVSLRAVARDRNGNSNETRLEGSIAIDSTPPRVLAVLPADGDLNVTDSGILQVRFSEPVDVEGALAAFAISPDPGGVNWEWNAARTAMTATHDPFTVGTSYTCRLSPGVMDLSSPGNADPAGLDWSFATPEVAVPMPSIALVTPGGGERLYWDEQLTVRWTASSRTGALAIDLSISGNGTAGPFQPLASGLPNNGQHLLDVPTITSDGCMLEAVARDSAGKRARSLGGPFSIARPLSLESELPPAGTRLLAGSPVRVLWATAGGAGSVVVELSLRPDANETAGPVLSGLPRSGYRDWVPPEINTDSARLLLRATDGWGRTVEASSGPLSIFTKDPPPPPPPPPRPNRPPVVLLAVREGGVTAGKPATFDASGSFDPEGDPIHFSWDFGDGTARENTTSPVLSHVYPDAGDYTLLLTVGDPGNETRQSMLVHVGPRPASGDPGREGLLSVAPALAIIIPGSAGIAWAALVRPGRTPVRRRGVGER